MSIHVAQIKIIGKDALLQNNPQTVDTSHPLAREMARFTRRGAAKTDENRRLLADLEVRSKVHWDDEEKVVAPTSWLIASIVTKGYPVARISKEKMRGALMREAKFSKLHYSGEHLVKTLDDVVGNPKFRHAMILPQGKVRILKHFPIFHNWWFEMDLEYDDTIVDGRTLQQIVEFAATYGGFGDFRPTYGTATAEVTL